MSHFYFQKASHFHERCKRYTFIQDNHYHHTATWPWTLNVWLWPDAVPENKIALEQPKCCVSYFSKYWSLLLVTLVWMLIFCFMKHIPQNTEEKWYLALNSLDLISLGPIDITFTASQGSCRHFLYLLPPCVIHIY